MVSVANPLEDQRLLLSGWRVGRLTQLLLVGVTMQTFNIMAMNAANSLFLSNLGAEALPICFTLLGLVSAVAYTAISQVVDQVSRAQLFRYGLILAAAIALGLRLVLNLEIPALFFLSSIGAFFQFDVYVNILYPNLIKDYLTTLEYKRYAPLLGVGQAVGILLGGGITVLLSQLLTTEDILACITVFHGLTFLQMLYLENTQQRLETYKPSTPRKFWQTFQGIPEVVKRYPLALFLASTTFLSIIVYIVSEFLWFSVYADTFTEETLTGFLGMIRVSSSLAQVLILFGFTRPLLRWVGVARMNVVFPISTLASLLGLALRGSLPFAVALNINGDALGKSINVPVHQLNYNALPGEYSGRVRALSDGVFYGIGLTLAGILLWFCHTFLSMTQISWIGVGLAAAFLALRVPMGRFYTEGLEEMIRSNTLNLDDLRAKLPAQSGSAIQELITQGDRYAQIKGLELAATFSHPTQFLPNVEPLLLTRDNEIRQAALKVFSKAPEPRTIQHFLTLLSNGEYDSRDAAMEVLTASRYSFDDQQLLTLLQDPDQQIRALAAVAAAQLEATEDMTIQRACDRVWREEALEEDAAKAIVRVISCSESRDLMGLLQQVLQLGNAEAKRGALEALGSLTRAGDLECAELAVEELKDPDPLVRTAAFKLVGITRCKGMLRHVAPGLGDPDPRVRQSVAQVLAIYGKQGMALAQDGLSSSDPEVVKTAIAALGQARTKQASNILFDYLSPDFQQVALTIRWQQQIPRNEPGWQPLAVAIEDYHQRLIQKVLYVLACLGHSRTVTTVNRILNANDTKEAANAVEVLASLSNRRFVLPLLPILEQLGTPVDSRPKGRLRATRQWLRTKGYQLLMETLESSDRWITIGALIALAMVPTALMRDPDPLVKTVAQQMFLPIIQRSAEKTFMNRILLLKTVPLFTNLTLDELLLIDKMLEQEQVLSGDTIYQEGSWGTYLYIIAEGNVQIIKTLEGEQQILKELSAGEHFGEVALFDDSPYWNSAVATKECLLLKLDKKNFISLVTQRPNMLLEICRFLSQQLREMNRVQTMRRWLPATETIEVEELASSGS